MKKRRNSQISTPKRVYNLKKNLLDPETRLFVELCVLLQYPQAQAWTIAFPDSVAKGGSASAQACKLLQSYSCRDYGKLLAELMRDGYLEPNKNF